MYYSYDIFPSCSYLQDWSNSWQKSIHSMNNKKQATSFYSNGLGKENSSMKIKLNIENHMKPHTWRKHAKYIRWKLQKETYNLQMMLQQPLQVLLIQPLLEISTIKITMLCWFYHFCSLWECLHLYILRGSTTLGIFGISWGYGSNDCYISLRCNPRVRFEPNQLDPSIVVFRRKWDFFQDFLNQPGAPLE